MKQPAEFFTGVLDDPRSVEERAKDWQASEILASAGEVEWVFKAETDRKRYPIWNQNGTGACVAFSFCKAIAIEVFRITGVWVDLSPAFFYQLRADKTSAGMNINNACEIAINYASTLEALMPSQNLTEVQINSVKRTRLAEEIAKAMATAVEGYLYLPKDMDAIARIIDQGKGVPILTFFNFDEWTEVPTVKYPDLTYYNAQGRHEVIITDRFKHPELGRVFEIEDSWGVGHGQGGRRLVTEDWFYKRVLTANYFDKFNLDGAQVSKPKYRFTKFMDYQEGYNPATDYKTLYPDVVALQNILKYEGLFPIDKPSTGFYGNITRTGVKSFQKKYRIASDAVIEQYEGKHAHQGTIAKLNELYG